MFVRWLFFYKYYAALPLGYPLGRNTFKQSGRTFKRYYTRTVRYEKWYVLPIDGLRSRFDRSMAYLHPRNREPKTSLVKDLECVCIYACTFKRQRTVFLIRELSQISRINISVLCTFCSLVVCFSTNIARLCRLVQVQRTGNLCRKHIHNPVKGA